MYSRIKHINVLWIMRAKFLTVREENYTYEKGKDRRNPVVLDWNWRYQYELVVSNKYG